MATDPRYTHTLVEFIAAGQASTDLSYSKLSYVEKRDGIDFPVRNIIDDYNDEMELKFKLTYSEYQEAKEKLNEIASVPENALKILLKMEI